MSNLIDLAERIERAKGPSYALDCEIWDAIYPGERQARFDKLTAKGQPYYSRLGPADMDGYVQPLRAFTASIDAAVTLVPEGWHGSVGVGRGAAEVWKPGKIDSNQFGCSATPALALTAAALRACSCNQASS
ncbi:hypothetical protein MRBLMC3_002876 [Sphingobium sp. LMC3-1-1.1]|uniref:hypothetical protein n=1 Tax=Sphingobium sp. LMC3-1-1.1 TaxID=3135241 RepID=UPI00341758B7